MRQRAAQSLNPEMGRMGAEDPSTAFSAAPLAAEQLDCRETKPQGVPPSQLTFQIEGALVRAVVFAGAVTGFDL
jgi:hypothetical protein